MKIELLIILCLTFIYTLLRYVVFGDINVTQIPIFLVNKSLSMASVIFLFLSAFYFLKHQEEESKYWGNSALNTALLHILLSLSILSNAYYPKFFTADRLSWQGGVLILFGALAIFFFFITEKSDLPASSCKKYCQLAVVCIAMHLFFMGYTGWLTINNWPGFMPPISLLSFLIVVAAGIFYLKAKGEPNEKKHSRNV